MNDETNAGTFTLSSLGIQEGYLQDELHQDAATIEQLLRAIQRAMRHAVEEDKKEGSLTTPQLQAISVLAQSPHSLTIKELSERMELAHSTVSGIIDRLERRGLIHRIVDSLDRRYTRVEIASEVKSYMQHRLSTQLLSPLLVALQPASEVERKTILEGLNTLYRLFLIAAELDK